MASHGRVPAGYHVKSKRYASFVGGNGRVRAAAPLAMACVDGASMRAADGERRRSSFRMSIDSARGPFWCVD